MHPGRAGRGDAVAAVLDDGAARRSHAHRRRRVQEQVRSRLAVLDVLAAEDPVVEPVQQAGQPRFRRILAWSPLDATHVAKPGGLDRVDAPRDAVDGSELARRTRRT